MEIQWKEKFDVSEWNLLKNCALIGWDIVSLTQQYLKHICLLHLPQLESSVPDFIIGLVFGFSFSFSFFFFLSLGLEIGTLARKLGSQLHMKKISWEFSPCGNSKRNLSLLIFADHSHPVLPFEDLIFKMEGFLKLSIS